MPSARGHHKVKAAKAPQADSSAPVCVNMTSTKAARSWKVGIQKATFLSRTLSELKPAGTVSDQPTLTLEPSYQQKEIVHSLTSTPEPLVDSTDTCIDLGHIDEHEETSDDAPSEIEPSVHPTSTRNSIFDSTGGENIYDEISDTFQDLTFEGTQSSASSLYSRDSTSIYSHDSASIYSSASSTYSSGASVYSSDASTYGFDDDAESNFDLRVTGRLQHQQRARPVPVRRPEYQDVASRERSTLAKKAALFKNSRLPPGLPSFNTTLRAWSMICRAAQASQDCYDSNATTRRGTYFPANTAKDIKAMIIDDQWVDDSQLVIVSIRGTEISSLADWSVNKAADPIKPVAFLDDEDNACHSGFLQVTKAMIGQIAGQLQQHPAASKKPSLLFTGHSAGGAVAAMLYSHMLSKSVSSDLTVLANQFPSINCVTFGAPPLSLAPLPIREHGSGIFLSFANEGDPVLRLSNAAYVKSLAKLMTASPPSNIIAPSTPPVKMVRHSRGTRVIRQTIPTTQATPWEELPLWPTPAAPLTNAGNVILLRDKTNTNAVASCVTAEQLSEVIFADLTQHTIDVYLRRIKEASLDAMMGRSTI